MRQVKNIILSMILLVTSSSLYAQYPIVKKIGNDTVVVMTLKQGEEVNKKFDVLKDSLSFYKNNLDTLKSDYKKYQIMSGRRLQKMYESYWQEYENVKSQKELTDSFRHMYMANKLIYLENERRMKRDVRHATIYSTVLTVLVMFFAAL